MVLHRPGLIRGFAFSSPLQPNYNTTPHQTPPNPKQAPENRPPSPLKQAKPEQAQSRGARFTRYASLANKSLYKSLILKGLLVFTGNPFIFVLQRCYNMAPKLPQNEYYNRFNYRRHVCRPVLRVCPQVWG